MCLIGDIQLQLKAMGKGDKIFRVGKVILTVFGRVHFLAVMRVEIFQVK